jgi:hypothetical protein
MRVRFLVEADAISGLQLGETAMVEVDGERYTGKIKAIALEPESINGKLRYPVEVRFASEQRLHAGQPATVSVP